MKLDALGIPTGRRLARSETHDLSMIIKDRTKVLRAYAEEQAASCMADFEAKLAARYSFDDDEVWKAAHAEAVKVVEESKEKIAKRCEKLGIPRQFAPTLEVVWMGRGENALTIRRTELRRVAKTEVDAMMKSALTKIEKQSLDLRTQVVAMGLLSSDAKLFLESLAPIEENMRMLDFAVMERKLEDDKKKRIEDRRRYG